MVACEEDDKTVEMKHAVLYLFLGYIVLVLFVGRSDIDGYMDYAFRPWEVKRLKENMSWKEWLLFSRFRGLVPKTLLYPYYFFSLLYALGFIACLYILIFAPEHSAEVNDRIVIPIFLIHGIYLGITCVLFFSADRTKWAYGRWYKLPGDREKKIRLEQMKKGRKLLEQKQEQAQQKERKKTTGNRRKTGTRRKGKREGNKKKK